MLEFISHLSSYAPAVIFLATALDIFFATGLILYGAAMLGSVAMLHGNGMISAEMIIFSAYSGTLFGNIANFFVGKLFGETSFVKKRLDNPKVNKARVFLKDRGLFLFILISRFITFTRPVYAVLLGSLKIKFHNYIIFEAIIAFFWIVFWLFIILQGEELYFWLFR